VIHSQISRSEIERQMSDQLDEIIATRDRLLVRTQNQVQK
jgi:hypothetical protein